MRLKQSELYYKASIGSMRLRQSELWESDPEAQELKSKKQLSDGWEDIDGVLHHQRLPFIPKVIWTELISWHHNNILAAYFVVDKTRELVGRKYYWPSLRKDVEFYVKGCDVCLTSKTVRHKPYGDLQFLLSPTHQWKDFRMDFVTGLPLSADWKGNNYDSILVIVN